MNNKIFGIVGLGRIGGGFALHAIGKGYTVIGFDRRRNEELSKGGVAYADSIEEMMKQLPKPRCVFIWVPAGKAVDAVAEEIAKHAETGDIIIDGGNSYWGDSKRRAETYTGRGFYFLDMGTSGGVEGARNMPCLMIGGPREAVAQIEPMLVDLAVKGGYAHAGPSGAGHFVKLVHNGIEFGMLQAIGEGMALLKHFPDQLKIAETLECWRNGSVIRSWLIDLMTRAYKGDPEFKKTQGYIEDTGEVNWLIGDALAMDVPVPVIAQSIMALMKSRDATRIADKAIIEMRHEFGGHPYGPDEAVRTEREHGRVGAIYRVGQRVSDR